MVIQREIVSRAGSGEFTVYVVRDSSTEVSRHYSMPQAIEAALTAGAKQITAKDVDGSKLNVVDAVRTMKSILAQESDKT